VVAVIKSFADKDTERLWKRERPIKTIPTDIQKRALIRLVAINAAKNLHDLNFPRSNRLKALKGDKQGLYSIRINDQFRVVFSWQDGNAHDVEVTDYH
jgi:proteic killer suppression protein